MQSEWFQDSLQGAPLRVEGSIEAYIMVLLWRYGVVSVEPKVPSRPNSGHFHVTVCGVMFCPFTNPKALKTRLEPPPKTHEKSPFQ